MSTLLLIFLLLHADITPSTYITSTNATNVTDIIVFTAIATTDITATLFQ